MLPARRCRTSLTDRNAIASAVTITTSATGNLRSTHPSDPSASSQPPATARCPARPVCHRRCSALSPSARKRLKSPLVRPGASASGLSLSDGSMRIEWSARSTGEPRSRSWIWVRLSRHGRVVSPGRLCGRPRRPCSERVVAARALSCTCMSSALRLSQSASLPLFPSVPLHPRACACVVPTLGWPAGGLRELCSVFGARVKMLTVCARSFEMGLEPRLIT